MPFIRTHTIGAVQAQEGWPSGEPIPPLPEWPGGPVPHVDEVPVPQRPIPHARAPRVRVLGLGILAGVALFALGVAISRRGGTW